MKRLSLACRSNQKCYVLIVVVVLVVLLLVLLSVLFLFFCAYWIFQESLLSWAHLVNGLHCLEIALLRFWNLRWGLCLATYDFALYVGFFIKFVVLIFVCTWKRNWRSNFCLWRFSFHWQPVKKNVKIDVFCVLCVCMCFVLACSNLFVCNNLAAVSASSNRSGKSPYVAILHPV